MIILFQFLSPGNRCMYILAPPNFKVLDLPHILGSRFSKRHWQHSTIWSMSIQERFKRDPVLLLLVLLLLLYKPITLYYITPAGQFFSNGFQLAHVLSCRILFGNADQKVRIASVPLETSKAAWSIGKIIQLLSPLPRKGGSTTGIGAPVASRCC